MRRKLIVITSCTKRLRETFKIAVDYIFRRELLSSLFQKIWRCLSSMIQYRLIQAAWNIILHCLRRVFLRDVILNSSNIRWRDIMSTVSSCFRRFLLKDVAQKSLNYRWRDTRDTHLTARVTSTITMYHIKLKRRVRIRTECYSEKDV